MKNDYHELTENIEMLSVSKTKKWHCWRQWILLPLVIVAFMMTNFSLSAQEIPGIAPVQSPVGGFGVDGDAYANTPIPDFDDVGDWFYRPNEFDGDGGGLINLDGNVENVDRTFFLQDGWKNGPIDETVFASNNAIDDHPNSMNWKRGDAPSKNEIQNAAVHFSYGDSNLGGDPNDLWCIFAADRWDNDGSSYIDFEFLQKSLTQTVTGQDSKGYDNGGFVTEGIDGGRTVDDLLVTIEFTTGGVAANVTLRTWQPDGNGGFEYVVQSHNSFDGTVYATVNNDITYVPFNAYDNLYTGTDPAHIGEYVYDKNQWAEGAVNLTKILNLTDNPCYTLATVFVRTRSSGSAGNQSQLKDMPGFPIQLNLDLTELLVTCASGSWECTDEITLDAAFANWLDTAFENTGSIDPITEKYFVGGVDTPLDQILPPDSCGGTVEVTYSVTDACELEPIECKATFTVIPDTEAPVIADPDDVNITECNVDWPALPTTTWTDACDSRSGASITGVYDANLDESTDCTQTRYYKFNITDECGNPAIEQMMKVTRKWDKTPPVITCAADKTVECNANIVFDPPTAIDICDANPSIEIVSTSPDGLTRTWKAVDACGNESATCSQTITVLECCETAFAKYEGTDAPEGQCFKDDEPISFSEWGWTNYFACEGTYEMNLYSGVGQCSTDKGTNVGTATVEYLDGNVKVTYNLIDGYAMEEAHLYVGCEAYPMARGKYTVAPGKYPFNPYLDGYVKNFIIQDISATGGIHVIAHAVVCEKLSDKEGSFSFGGWNVSCQDDTNITCNDAAKPELSKVVSAFNAYPVPFDEVLTVEYKYEYDTDVQVEVYDTKGMLITNETDTTYEKGTIGKTELDLSRVADQTLIIKVISSQEVMSKMVISKSIEK